MTTNSQAGAPARRLFHGEPAGRRWLAAVVFAAIAVVAMKLMVALGQHAGGGRVAIPLVAFAPVIVLRRWPLPVLAAVTVAAGTLTAWGYAMFPLGLLLGLALYFATLELPRPRSIVLAMAVAASLGVAVAYSAFAVSNAPLGGEVTETFVPLAAAWFIADSVAARRRYLAAVATQAEQERAAEVREERLRIAREMHDVVAHALAVITVQAGVGRCLSSKRPEQMMGSFGSIETISRTAADELRVVLDLLRDREAELAPLAPAPRLVDIKDLADTVRASGVPVELRMSGTDRPLSPSLELSVYRVVQEALTNVVKHAPGARAMAELTVTAGTIRVDVRDDGGQPGAAVTAGLGAGHGITGMRERIGAFGGWLVAGPAPGGGFQVSAEVPIESAAS